MKIRVLTDEQIARARDAIYAAGDVDAGLHAAAPFLQMPWIEPTVEEWSAIYRDATSLSARLRVCEFVRRRNAALLPKPVDPIRNAVEQAFTRLRDRGSESSYHAAVDEAKRLVLELLDEVKP